MLIVVDGAHADAADVHGTGTDAAASSLSGDAVVGEAFDAAVALLRGSFANYILCCSAMAISCAFTLVGFVMMTEGDSTSRTLLVVSMFFLLSQTFTLAKASRDKAMVAMALRDPTGPKSMKVFAPTRAYLAQVLVFFIIAVGSSLYSLFEIEADDPVWYAFGSLDILWLLVVTFCLSKSVRDRRNADAWSTTTHTHTKQSQLRQILQECAGTLEYRVLVYLSCFCALGFTLGFTWASWMPFAIERRGFLSLGLIFHASSCFHMAKLVRDRNDSIKMVELSKQIPYQAMVVASFLLSWLIPLAGVCSMGLDEKQLLFQLTGQLMTTNTTLNLAKVVRDRLEMSKLREDLTNQGYVV